MEECVIKQLEEQLGYFDAIVQYLDVSGNLTLLKAQCEKYAKTKSLVYTFKLLIDPSDICEANAILGNLLLREPITATDVFKQVIYKAIQVLELLPETTSLSQVAVILRLSSLPVLPKLTLIENIRCLSRVHDARIFCSLTGVVTGLSALSKYTLSARYYCTDEDCQGHHGNHFIRIHTPGASEAQTVRKDFKCSFCSLTLTEEKSSRTLSEKVVAEVIPEQIMSDIHSHSCKRSRGQAIPVYIRDDLTKLVEIGETYEIIGISRKDVLDDKIMLTLEANNIKKIKTEISASKLLKELPRNLLTIYKDRKSSPWSFVLTLAYLFGGEISPPGCHFSLKLALLLSLVSKKDTKTKPLHVLALGSDSEIISRLLQFGTRFKHSSTSLTAGQSLTGLVTVDRYNSSSYFVEGGLLHLSQGGVCNVGDIDRLKKSTKHCLQSALSGGKIVTDVAPKYTGSLPHHIEQRLKSRIWGYSNPTLSRKQSPKDSDVFVGACTGDIPKTLLDAFSLICFIDHGDITSNEMVEGQMVETTLVAALNYDITDTDTATQLPVSTEDFQQFVRFASQLRPKFRKEAETLIHNYYMTCRKTRSTSDGTDVPVNADQTLLSLAYSHAKLALRNEVTLNDALMAVKLYEEYLTNRFGYSTLNVQPIPHITASLLNYCIGPANDKQMQDFHRNLLRYCSLASGLEE